MGNTKSGAMSKEILEELKMNTKFSEMELVQWYENFKRQCPSERITKEEFQEIYSKFFPDSDAQTYSQHVFRSFDTNADGTLDFKEYIIALHMTSTGKTTTMKLEWAFGLFDVDKNGYIIKSEVKEICTAIFRMIPKDEIWKLPSDENTADKRAEKLWRFFKKSEKDRVTESEFIQGVLANEAALRLIQYQPLK
ncbi:recoverin-like [Takifugu rubripes]|uniref:Recoverin 3 n=1 Tax=Takifugu rubripes TaxID=31033 RepID=H2T1T3_TAKRU|nr:recoverin-like [Takifugu rubripes]XP_011607446.2 recoverin-like [Takifugu rubripes]XP_029700847.1 recoverin-like [Takifugu rubripes]XP_029700848.1 recoverin-like [Takifugu rubripes]XP_029700849.1 recoverin-like [Takifugu rubripes]